MKGPTGPWWNTECDRETGATGLAGPVGRNGKPGRDGQQCIQVPRSPSGMMNNNIIENIFQQLEK